MRNEKELILNLIKKQMDCEFSLRFFLQRENDLWKNVFAMLKLVKKGTRKKVKHNYGEYVLGEKLLTIQEGTKTISALYQENEQNLGLVIPNYDEFAIQNRRRFQFIPSKQRYGLLRDDWPIRLQQFEVTGDRKGRSGEKELLYKNSNLLGIPYSYFATLNVFAYIFNIMKIMANDTLSLNSETFIEPCDSRFLKLFESSATNNNFRKYWKSTLKLSFTSESSIKPPNNL